MGSRAEVLRLFKCLHRTSQSVFRGDSVMLAAARNKINGDFKSSAGVSSAQATASLIQHGWDCDKVLRENVVQAEIVQQTEDSSSAPEVRLRPKITEETYKFENTVFRDDITDAEYNAANRSKRKKCSDQSKEKKV